MWNYFCFGEERWLYQESVLHLGGLYTAPITRLRFTDSMNKASRLVFQTNFSLKVLLLGTQGALIFKFVYYSHSATPPVLKEEDISRELNLSILAIYLWKHSTLKIKNYSKKTKQTNYGNFGVKNKQTMPMGVSSVEIKPWKIHHGRKGRSTPKVLSSSRPISLLTLHSYGRSRTSEVARQMSVMYDK